MAATAASTFELIVPDAPFPLEVISFRGREAISKPYRFEVHLRGPEIDTGTIEREYLGQRAFLRFGTADHDRRAHGILSRMEAEPVSGDRDGGKQHYRAWLSPVLWLLGRGQSSRIFQDTAVPDIVRTVLGEGGVRVRLRLLRAYTPRAYCVQYEESDLRFVERLLREEGIFYFFESPADEGDDEILVLADDASACTAIDGDPVLHFRDSGGMEEQSGDMRRFRLVRRVAPGKVMLKGFDFMRPSYANTAAASTATLDDPLSALAGLADGLPGAEALRRIGSTARAAGRAVSDLVEDPERAARRAARLAERRLRNAGRAALSAGVAGVSEALGAAGGPGAASLFGAAGVPGFSDQVIEPEAFLSPDDVEVFAHHEEHERAPIEPRHATTRLEQERRDIWIGTGEARCHRLAPGRRFELSGAPLPSLNGAYVAFEVDHFGQDPSRAAAGAGRPEIYRCELRTVPASWAFRPRPPKRQVQQVLETAIVTGPAGQEIYTDTFGRIKVQFHWDRRGLRNERSSCWIRVLQPWAGSGWGVQFIPRIGMEVTVGFVGGDMDRPVVLGSVYNAERPPPFPLPADKTKSGIRTESTRGGGGHNELSFEDRKGHERVHVRAEKDLDVLVRNNETRRVEVNQVTNVGVNQYNLVQVNRLSSVGGSSVENVAKDRSVNVEGDRKNEVHGASIEVVHQSASVRVGEDLHTRVAGSDRREVDTDVDLRVRRDHAARVLGNYSMVVGSADALRSSVIHTVGSAEYSASEVVEIEAKKGVHLRCGKSVLVLLPDRITICSPEIGLYAGDAKMVLGDKKARIVATDYALLQAEKTHLRGSGATVELTAEVVIKGSAVKLKSGSASQDEIDGPGARTLTKIELQDQDGNPLPYQRFVARLGDGSERVGVLDENGKAEIEIEGGGPATIVFPDLSEIEAQ